MGARLLVCTIIATRSGARNLVFGRHAYDMAQQALGTRLNAPFTHRSQNHTTSAGNFLFAPLSSRRGSGEPSDSRQSERVILLVEEDGVGHDEEREDEDEQEHRVPGGGHVQRAAEQFAPRLAALHVARPVGRVDRQQYDG